jgi:HAD superfamily hydrolase (TIGR01490 family)
MPRVAAIFDVDQTLVQGYTERLFFRFLVRHGLISVPQAMQFLGHLAWRPQDRFQDKSYLHGLEVEPVLALARQCYQEEISPRVSLHGLDCILEHQARDHDIILLTGSLSFLLLPLKEELAAGHLIATEVQREGGRFTGEIAGLHPHGKNKLELLVQLARQQGLDLSRSYAYGDHMTDLVLLHQIGHPVVVNPSWRLKRQARRHRWPIRYF